MGALPHPSLAPGPHRELVEVLHSLHHRAGWPSLRRLATQTGVSHTTVSNALSSPTLPSWGTVELLVEAMGGDVPSAHELWLAASSPASPERPTVAIAGRRAELDVVRRHLQSGTGLLVVTGGAGMGKTTLVNAASASTEALVLVGHCLRLSSEVPLLPVVEALRAVHTVDDGQWSSYALAACPAFVRSSLARLLPELDDGSTSTPSDDQWGQERLLSAVTTFLRTLADTRPLALHFEDGHWADRGTLDLLAQLAAGASPVPLVLTWRIEDPDVSPEHAAWLSRTRWAPGTSALDLEPLDVVETTEQLRLLTGSEPTDEAVTNIHDRSGGLPLYTAQLAMAGPGAELPRHLAELLDQRIGDLADTTWQVARALGLAQRPLTAATLRTASGLDAEHAVEGLRELARRGLIRSGTGDLAALAHPLFVEAIERRLLPGEAPEVHARLAEALAAEPGIEPGEVADHWRSAGRPDLEVDHRVAAARRAAERFAFQEELDAWLRVLEVWDEGVPGGGIELWEVLVRALDDTVDLAAHDTARALVRRAAQLDLPNLPGSAHAQVLHRLGLQRYEEGDLDEAVALLDEAERLWDQLPHEPALVRLLTERAGMAQLLGREAETAAAMERLEAVRRELDDDSFARRTAAGQVWEVWNRTGDPEAALAVARSVLAASPAGIDPIADLMIAANATDLPLHASGPSAAAREIARAALEEADAWGLQLSYPAVLVRGNAAWSDLLCGDTVSARQWVEPVTRGSPTANTAFAHIMLAAVELREGQVAEAVVRSHAADAQVLARDENWAPCVPWVAEADLWAGDAGAAWQLLSEALLPRIGAEQVRCLAPLLVVAARARADELDATPAGTTERRWTARELRDLVAGAFSDPFGADTHDAAAPACSLLWQAEVARAEGTVTMEVWARASTAWDALTRPHEAAYCRWRAAQCALRDGQGTIAARLLKKAAVDAREHVPLADAIAATVRTGR